MMSLKRIFSSAALALIAVVLSPAAHAAEPPVTWLMNAGYAAPVGQTSDYLQGGWTIGGGLAFKWQPSSPLSAQFDLSYSDFNATKQLINLGQTQTPYRIDNGRAEIWALTGALKFTGNFSDGVHGYGLLGIGGYHRYVELTQTAVGYVCDPWWGICYAGTGEAVVANKSVTKFGWNAGIGAEFPLRYGGAWFLEARYHWIDGSKQTEYVPIQIGYRF
jgi:opacity protein-like surface antigen